jgi:isoamylase
MHDFVRQLFQFRKQHAYAFAPLDYGAGAPFRWENEAGQQSPDWGSRHVAMHYYDSSRGKQLDVLINMEVGAVNFTLPAGVSWVRAIDTQAWFDGTQYVSTRSDSKVSYNIALPGQAAVSGSYGVQGRSVVVLVEN